ncbi:hypothetical protein PAMP_007943 [Pampus punctatissimus]
MACFYRLVKANRHSLQAATVLRGSSRRRTLAQVNLFQMTRQMLLLLLVSVWAARRGSPVIKQHTFNPRFASLQPEIE